ncbi:hypothetical protein PY730_27880 (plasmid) [Klebsiella pneumoniae]|nr:hypothetical protein PY730_27880 [Klebsiella pneumoniae]
MTTKLYQRAAAPGRYGLWRAALRDAANNSESVASPQGFTEDAAIQMALNLNAAAEQVKLKAVKWRCVHGILVLERCARADQLKPIRVAVAGGVKHYLFPGNRSGY